MRPLDEQTVLITGATDGLGRAVATELAAAGATLLIHGRDDARGQQTIDDIAARTGSRRLHWLRADLASLDEVRDLAERVLAGFPQLGVLVNKLLVVYQRRILAHLFCDLGMTIQKAVKAGKLSPRCIIPVGGLHAWRLHARRLHRLGLRTHRFGEEYGSGGKHRRPAKL